MGVSVNEAALREIMDKAKYLASSGFREETLKTVAEEVRRLVVSGFDNSTSPDGEPWAELQHRDGLPLLDTGRLRNSIRVQPTHAGIQASTNLVYGATHQYGRGAIPARPFFPVAGMPSAWAEPIRGAIDSLNRRVK